MRNTWVRDSIGKRMKESAEGAELSAATLARRLGVSQATVYRWWEGERVPSAEMMERYAETVGKDASWMYGSVDDQQVLRDVTEILLEITKMVTAGKRLDLAYDEALGAPLELSVRERKSFQQGNDDVRRLFSDLPEDEDQRRRLLRHLAVLLKANGR